MFPLFDRFYFLFFFLYPSILSYSVFFFFLPFVFLVIFFTVYFFLSVLLNFKLFVSHFPSFGVCF